MPTVSAALLIDDDEDLLASVNRAARASRVDLVTASSWDAGLGLFHVLSPILVIADYNMPGSRHGLQLLARIRRLRPGIRLILVSGYLDEEDMAQVRALNLVDEALTKGTAEETAETIMAQVRAANEQASEPTDWQAVARAAVGAARVGEEDLDRLDEILAKKTGAGEDARGS
jgi:DNA-binding NtrC family response regulator